ncbi:MAG: aspartyl protease family protein [Ktedonobacteraceae bacterium]|nr:aspartyl protease family protein [Ktedonobacteraceae bacterium]
MKPCSVTVPLHIVRHRPFIDVEWTVKEQHTYTTRCWLDTGGGAVIITEQLAQKLGVSYRLSQRELVPALLPAMNIRGMLFDFKAVPTFVALGQSTIQGEEGVEVFCGAPFLGKYHIIFDYPQHQLTLAALSTVPLPAGIALPLHIHPQSKFPRIEIMIEGDTYGMLLDTGASMTMMSQAVINRWTSQHPEWRKEPLFPQNQSSQYTQSVEIPQLDWGPYHVKDTQMIARPTGVFEQTLSQGMSAPVVGALAGNVLRQFRCEINYETGILYLLHEPNA